MVEISFEQIFKRGFGGLVHANGRDNRTQFWIFCALVFGPLIVLQMIAQIVLTFPDPDVFIRAGADAGVRQGDVWRDMQAGLMAISHVMIVFNLVVALLLLTAVARRLHDRGRSGWGALILPLAAIVAGFSQMHRMQYIVEHMPRLIAEMERRGTSAGPEDMFTLPLKLQAGMPGPDWLAIVAGLGMLWLAIELVRAGTDGPNRFGPVPQ